MDKEIYDEIRIEFGSAVMDVGVGGNYFGNTPKNTETPYGNYHYHVFDEIQIIMDGKVVIVTDTSRITVKKGELIIIPASTQHFTDEPESEHSRVCLDIRLKQITGEPDCFHYFKDLIRENALSVLPAGNDILKSIKEITELRNDVSLTAFCSYKTELYNMVSALFMLLSSQVSADNPTSFTYEKNIKLEDMVFDIRVSKAEIAERLGYSLRHIERLIRKTYGCSLTELRSRSMIEAAKRMIDDDPSVSLEKVINTTGFTGYTALYRAFMKNTGVSPGQYKYNNNEKEKIK